MRDQSSGLVDSLIGTREPGNELSEAEPVHQTTAFRAVQAAAAEFDLAPLPVMPVSFPATRNDAPPAAASQSEATRCPNCGGSLAKRFCPDCGQERLPLRETARTLVLEFFENLFAFDSLIVRSGVPLLCKPGFLTNEYMTGRRKRYVSPLKMYLVSSLLFFAATQTLLNQQAAVVNLRSDSEPEAAASVWRKPGEEKRKRPQTPGTPTPDTSAEPNAPERTISRASLLDLVNPRAEELPTSLEGYERAQNGLPAGQRDGWWKRLLTRKAIRRAQMTNPEFNQQIWQNLPKAMLLTTPLFALLLLVVYHRTHRLLLEHLVFTLHTHTYSYLIFSIAALLVPVTNLFARAVPLLFISYQFMAMRRVYRQSFFRTALKTGLLLFLGLFITVLAILGVSVVSGLLL